ncbi:MAG: hypothetical protein Tsb0013_19960 [Phycisphaerales bacterium]
MPEPSIDSIMRLDLPIAVRLGEKIMRAGEVTALQPGTIIELPKSAEDPLELMVNNKAVGTGHAVKVGENFGIRLERIGDLRERIEAMGEEAPEALPEVSEDDADALADMLLREQGL